MHNASHYLEILLKHISNVGQQNKCRKLTDICLSVAQEEFYQDYTSQNKQIWTRIFDLITLMSSIDFKPHIMFKLETLLTDRFHNDEIFLNYLSHVQQETDNILTQAIPRISIAAEKLQKMISASPTINTEELDRVLYEIKGISQLRFVHLTFKHIFNQLSQMLEQTRYSIEKNINDEDIAIYIKAQYIVSCLLENINLKRVFQLSVNMIILLEKLRVVKPDITLKLHENREIFDLSLNVYRCVLIQKELSDEVNQLEFKSSISAQPQKPLLRITSKHEEEDIQIKKHRSDADNHGKEVESIAELKYEDLFVKLSGKAKHLLQEIFKRKSELNEVSTKNLIIQFPWLLTFEAKSRLFFSALGKADQNQIDSKLKLSLFREFIVEDTLEQVEDFLQLHKGALKICNFKVRVEFRGEPGIDQGGVTNEWLTLVCKKIFDPSFKLFELTSNKSTIHPNPQSQSMLDYNSYYTLAGFLVGLAITQKIAIPVNFSRPFLKLILDKAISVYDLQSIDEELMKSLDWMLKNQIDGTELEKEFTYEMSLFGSRYKVSLEEPEECLDFVCDANKKQFVKRLIYHKLFKEIEPQIQAFKSGIHRLIDKEQLQTILPSELDKFIAGEALFNFDEMRKTTQYKRGYDDNSEQIVWFWEVVSEFDQEMLSNLWFFATGMNRVGVDGFTNKPLVISKYNTDQNRLPLSHTWYPISHEIDLPEYLTKKDLSEKLLLAISEGNEGFAFG